MTITNAEISRIRTDLAVYMPDICAVLSPPTGVDSTGYSSGTWGTVSASVACLFYPQGMGKDKLTAEQINAPQAYILVVAYDQDLEAKYRVVYGGSTYEVESIESGGSWTPAKRAVCVKVVS